MKAVVSTFFFVFMIGLTVSAQQGQPKFGKVAMADLKMTDCDFDKGADAVVLIDFGKIYYDRGTVGFSDFKTVFERRRRIKILKEKGLAEADVEIQFYTQNNEERILNIDANTYNLDAAGKMQTTTVKKSSIYSKKIDGNYSKMIITFPEVKVGTIIEYTYTIERETYSLRSWYFQSNIPVRFSQYQIKVPQIFRFSVQPSVVDSITDTHVVIRESISMDEGFIETNVLKSNYIMRNLPGIKNEPFMGAARDYMQRLEFQMTQIVFSDNRILDLRSSWKEVVKNDLKKHPDFGEQLEKRIATASLLVDEARKINDAESKMKFVFDAVRKTVSWNGDYGIYSENGIFKTWETKTGNAADLNLLLIKLLDDAGLKVVPILFSTRTHGLVTPLYPFVSQFNSVMAYVVIGDRFFVLDATNKLTHYKLIPEIVANTNGFIVEGNDGKWKVILSGNSKYKVMAAIQGEIDENGKMNGSCLVNCYDYARERRCTAWKRNNDKFKEDYFIKSYPSLSIEGIDINNLEADSLPLEQKIKFSSKLSSSGDYRYFSLNLFSDLEKNPFLSDTRISDVDFGVQQDYIIYGNYTLPLGYSFDGVPENFAMATSDRGIIFNRSVQVDANLLNVRITVEFKRTFYPASSYPEFVLFYKKMMEKLNEQVVIKKKAIP